LHPRVALADRPTVEPEMYARQCAGLAVDPSVSFADALTVPATNRSRVAVGSS
jgi:hypothetical protein